MCWRRTLDWDGSGRGFWSHPRAQKMLIAKITLFSTQFCPDQALPSSCSCLCPIFLFLQWWTLRSVEERKELFPVLGLTCQRMNLALLSSGWNVLINPIGSKVLAQLNPTAPNLELMELSRATKGEAPGLLCSLSVRAGNKSASQLVPFTRKGH